MKKILYFAAATLLAILPGGCYEDKGNYDYADTGSITMTPTSDIYSYNIQMGDRLSIPMTVTTDVPESEIRYIWEAGVSASTGSINNFKEIPDTEGSKDFDLVMGPDELFPTNGSYSLRLAAQWKVNGETVTTYGPLIKVGILGLTGLMLLHGDDTGTDMGIIVDDIFQLIAGTHVNQSIHFNVFSEANGGALLPGKGVSLAQASNSSSRTPLIFVLTDQTAVTISQTNSTIYQNYEDFFFTMPGFTNYNNKPQRVEVSGTYLTVIDDGQAFQSTYTPPNTAKYHSKFAMPVAFDQLPEYRFSKNSYIQGMDFYFYDEISGCFVNFVPTSPNLSFRRYPSAFGPFNVDDMNADLLYIGRGGFGPAQSNIAHMLGVFRDREDGKVFLGEINFRATGDAGNPYAKFKYDPSVLTDFDSARFYATGIYSGTMCYYATDDAVYQFTALGDNGLANNTKLRSNEGEIPFSGEITMMKIMPAISSMFGVYQHSLRMLLVGTYDNGVGTLHALVLNTITGMAESHKTFTGFERIYDANIKFD